ncbi:hypothetical protein [Saccharothrix syringae]|uniref:Uncharacterized protein n=1 Tax=Saccharothrix syringae TaxID=103733 RepID=A0A5Q0GVT3_SACSY|nr:hypothetical protein [Saccharothrix syringae]QFZ17570.1 hypothetical protein EKG83_08820 [Saccharothrix syringae]
MTNPTERRLAAQIAANTRWSRQDGVTGTEAARRAFADSFEAAVDPDGVLPVQERARRAEAARRAHYAKLAHRSVVARRKTREAREAEARAAVALQAARRTGGAA